MQKKKITILLPRFGVGGAENMVYELVKNIDREQFDVTVLCYMQPNNVHTEKQVETFCSLIHLNQSGSITPATVWRVMKAMRKTKPDVVHAHLGGAAFGAIWSMLFRKNLVITVHAKPEGGFNRSKKSRFMVQKALRQGKTKMVAVSKENEILLQQYYGLSDERFTWINNGIDLHRFNRKEHECFTLINVAQHDDNKNQASLIRCFARLRKEVPNAKLLLLGDGPYHESLIQLAEELGVADAVTFTGKVPNTEDYYSASDLYVQTSFTEAMPLSVLEAMAAGLPVVSTNVGGLPDVVKGNGILVPVGDDDALYAAIWQIYTQPKEETEVMCKASLRIVQDYSAEHMARAYEKIYLEMCK